MLRVLALYVNYSTHQGEELDQTLYHSCVDLIEHERNFKQQNIIKGLLCDTGFSPFNLYNKLSVKILMVQIIESTFNN